MFTVTGYTDDGRAYTAAVDPLNRRKRTPYGIVTGPPFLLTLLLANAGRPVDVTPTGPTVTVDLTDPAAILAALTALTRVIDVDGDGIPAVLPPDVPGVVY